MVLQLKDLRLPLRQELTRNERQTHIQVDVIPDTGPGESEQEKSSVM
uniref:Uncharacterized protein n=1 Tax=Utricularia reniformis TaxID=192314 RepID=A0A1Y0B2M9_9LAMI|nr:hypothetical protein AEK19_MT1505 [Utricularia reniformis]ART31696.1 hypothetical protein AEK19_MT1505 [Utricularia reniformis]